MSPDVSSPWQEFCRTCMECKACSLYKERKQAVIWRGSVKAPLLILGEGPGAQEDLQGKPFVGRSGMMLDDLLEALQIPEDKFHIANVVKCRPPGNRAPSVEEARACRPLLNKQFQFVQPQVIMLMGASAYKFFTGDLDGKISQVRGQWIHKGPYWILPTFHPAYILRNNTQKDKLWDDFKMLRAKMEELDLIEPIMTFIE